MELLPRIAKFKWIIFVVSASILLTAIIAVQFYQQSSTKSASDIRKESTQSSEADATKSEPSPSESQPPTIQGQQTGTCKITKNGVTSIVPADEVKVYERSAGDVNVKIECQGSQSNNNGSSTNKSDIKTDIKIETNTSN